MKGLDLRFEAANPAIDDALTNLRSRCTPEDPEVVVFVRIGPVVVQLLLVLLDLTLQRTEGALLRCRQPSKAICAVYGNTDLR